jgi:hypothetical protein|tara:strand:- start:3420 stop:3674 length:255 start_codon:yes stop_codon:yes gene_type:complete
MTVLDWEAVYRRLCSVPIGQDDYESASVELMSTMYRTTDAGLRDVAKAAGVSHWTVRAKLQAAEVEMKARGHGMQRRSSRTVLS